MLAWELLDASYQGVKRLFVLAYNDRPVTNDNVTTDAASRVKVDSHKNFLPRVNIENYNIKINGKNLYDQSVNDSI